MHNTEKETEIEKQKIIIKQRKIEMKPKKKQKHTRFSKTHPNK